MNDFNGIAWCYDPLKQLVFGNKLDQASTHFLSAIPAGSRLLIVGGGTGNLLLGIPDGVQICYVEKSVEMLKKARSRLERKVDLIHLDFLDYHPSHPFDYVVCPFFLDLFDPDSLRAVIKKISSVLKEDGKLLVADFSFQKSGLLRLMYAAFGVVTNISAKSIPPIHDLLSNSGFEMVDSAVYFNGLVFSHQYSHTSKYLK